MTKRRIQIAQPSLGIEEWEALREPLETGWLTQGPKVDAFEKAFAERHESKYAVAVTSCTTGLHLALVALGILPGDEVIVPALTWVATANVILYCGAKPVFVDIDPKTFNINPEILYKYISEKTKAIIPVHLFGRCANIDEIKLKLPTHITIIEDAACAAGATYKGRSAGSLGTLAVFSLHPRKSITTGEGGMITTNDPMMYEHLKVLRNHGASLSEEMRHIHPKPYLLPDFNVLGFNYRMTDLQGAIGLVQLKKLDSFIEERTYWANWYREQLMNIKWLMVPEAAEEGSIHGWQSFVCRINPNLSPNSRDAIMHSLHLEGIATRPGTHAVPMLKYYRDRFCYQTSDFEMAYNVERQSIAIPLHNKMTSEDYEYVVSTLKKL